MWTVLLLSFIVKSILRKLRRFDRIYAEGMRVARTGSGQPSASHHHRIKYHG